MSSTAQTGKSGVSPGKSGLTPLFPLLWLAIPVFFLYLGVNSIWDANEAFYVETPRNMVASGDYINPVFNGLPRVNKPVLSYWIVAGLYHLFGTTVAVERFGIALGAMVIIACAFLIGRALRNTITGVIAALIVATAPRVVMHSRRIFIDVYITAFMSIALACFVLAERHPQHRRRFLLGMYAAIGCGLLTKGPIAVVLPALACLVWLAMERRLSDIRRLFVVPGALIVLAIFIPWYATDYAQHGWAHIWTFFVGENVERYLNAEVPSRQWSFYLAVPFTELFPWAPLLVVPLLTAWRRASATDADATAASLRRLLWAWIVVIVGFFSLSATKQDLYIFPIVTAVAALVADLLVATEFGRMHRGVRLIVASVFVALSVLAGGVLWVFSSGYYQLAGVTVVVTIMGVTSLAGLVLMGRRRYSSAVLVLAAGFIAFNYVFVLRVLPSAERLKPVVPLAAVFKERASPTAEVGSYHYSKPSFSYYIGRPVTEIGTHDHAEATFNPDHEAWMVMDQAHFDELRATLPMPICIAARHPDLDFSAKRLLAGTPPPDVLLVRNRCR